LFEIKLRIKPSPPNPLSFTGEGEEYETSIFIENNYLEETPPLTPPFTGEGNEMEVIVNT